MLPIVNPGFEQLSRPLVPGEVTNGAGGVGVLVGTRSGPFELPQYDDPVEVPGWRTFLPSAPDVVVHAGVLHPPTGGQPAFLSGYSGDNVASLRHHWIQQTLPVRWQPNTHYSLSFLAGAAADKPGDGVYVALLGSPDLETLAFAGTPGVTTVTMSAFYPPFGSAGQMLPWSIEVTTPSVLPADLAGRFIAIAFIGSDGIPLMNYDDFRLEATRIAPRPRARRDSGQRGRSF